MRTWVRRSRQGQSSRGADNANKPRNPAPTMPPRQTCWLVVLAGCARTHAGRQAGRRAGQHLCGLSSAERARMFSPVHHTTYIKVASALLSRSRAAPGMYPNNGQQGYYQQNGQQQQGYQQQQPGYGQPPQGYPQQMHPQYQQHQQAGMPYGGQGMQPGMPMQPGMMPGMMPGMPYGGQGQQGYAQGRPQMGAGGQMQGTMGMNTGAAVFTPGGSFTPSAPAQSQEPQTPALVSWPQSNVICSAAPGRPPPILSSHPPAPPRRLTMSSSGWTSRSTATLRWQPRRRVRRLRS